MEFKIKVKEEELGPYSLEELKVRLSTGSLSTDALVRPIKGGGEFVPITDWISPAELEKEKKAKEASKAQPSPNANGVKKLPAKKFPMKKIPKRPSAPPTTARKVGKKNQSVKGRIITAGSSLAIAALLVLAFVFLWERTGVDLTLPTEEAELLKNGEVVSVENQNFRRGRMAPGEYEFALRPHGPEFEEWSSTVSVSFGRLQQKAIELQPVTAKLHLEAEERDVEFVLTGADGEEVESGDVPASLSGLQFGAYTVVFTHDSEESEEQTIYLHPENMENVELLEENQFFLSWAAPVEAVEEESEADSVEDLFSESDADEQEDPDLASLVIRTDPEEVRVGVFGPDGFIWRGQTPTDLQNLEPGEYEVEFRAENRDIERDFVDLAEGSSKTVERDFTGGTVTIITEPEGAFVRRGDRFFGLSPITLENMPRGDLEFEIGFPGEEFTTLEGTITDRPLILGARYREGSWTVEEVRYRN